MKYILHIIFSISLTSSLLAQDNAVLNIATGDAHHVSIDIFPSGSPQLLVFLKYEKLKKAQHIISDNYKKKISIQINGKTISEPTILIKPPYTGQSVSLGFKNIDQAVAAAKEILHTAEQGAAANP